jgi:uncharacterized protein YggE
MRRVCVGVGFVLVAALGVSLFQTRSVGQPAVAADPNHRITVSGSATVPVKPDTARVSVAVRASGNDVKSAVAECDKMGGEVEKALAAMKLKGVEVKKGPINLVNTGVGFAGGGIRGPGGPPPMPPGPMGVLGQPPMPGGFGGGFAEVTRTYTVVATFGQNGAGDLKDIVPVSDKILMTAVSAGATEPPAFNNNQNFGGGIGGFGGMPNSGNTRIEFHRANWTQLRQEALKLAVADAVANAKAAAGTANLTTKDIVAITDQSNSAPWGGAITGVPANTGRGEVLGEQELAVQVTVTFKYEPPAR